MKGIKRNTDYAIRALICMARITAERGKPTITVETIASMERLPRVFLRKLLQQLANKKILTSHKGKGGGFSLRRRPAEISIDEITTLFQGELDLTNCILSRKTCPRKKHCKLRKRLQGLNEKIRQELREITIAQLV